MNMSTSYLTDTYQHVSDVRSLMEDIAAQLEEALEDMRKAAPDELEVISTLQTALDTCNASATWYRGREVEAAEALNEAECAAREAERREMEADYWKAVL